MKTITRIIGLALLLALGLTAKANIGETNIDVVSDLVFVTWGTNHYSIPAWWLNSGWTNGNGVTNLDGGSVTNWAAFRAFNANFAFLWAHNQTLTLANSNLNWQITALTNAALLAATNIFTGTNDFAAGHLTIGGVPVGSGGGGTTLMLQASDNGTPMYLHVTSLGVATWTSSP
jgi:hypothetical protein